MIFLFWLIDTVQVDNGWALKIDYNVMRVRDKRGRFCLKIESPPAQILSGDFFIEPNQFPLN